MQRIPRVPILLAALLAAGTARAQASDPAAAEALFRDAKELVAAGRFAEACPKFLASYKLDPKPGAVVNLADCYEKNGQIASAWARYVEGASLAQRAGQVEREQYARDHARALEPKLSRVRIACAPAPGLEVRRDGELVDAATLGTALPVDAGKHTIEARAPGKKPWTTTVDVPLGGAPITVDVPPLEDGAASSAAVGPVAPPRVDAPPPGDAPPAPSWSAQRKAGVAVGVVGLVGLGVGAAFGAVALSKWSSAKNDHCSGMPLTCDAMGVSLTSDAKSAATLSSATFIPGAALLAAGVVVFATAPRGKAPATTGLVLAPAPLPGGASFTLAGRL